MIFLSKILTIKWVKLGKRNVAKNVGLSLFSVISWMSFIDLGLGNLIMKIKIQLPFLMLSVIIFLNLHFFLGKRIGLNGIVISTIILQLLMTFLLTIGTYKKYIIQN